ncbi:hypothetical protein HED60_07585 [Planctomycetales bacterium ZRK34]|nr:hypothetical protein HED60_07585 [Planctomycetales bacterium ZRK34]
MTLVYAGIDEAGYGPMFGPFVVARSVFVVDEDGATIDREQGPGSLWAMLKSAVCRKGSDKRKRIAVNDSKKLYTPAAGLAHLERAVLSFAHAAGHEIATLDDLLATVGMGDDSRVPQLLWYHDDAGGPGLPTCHTAAELSIARSMLSRHADRAAVRCAELAAAVVYEDRFNQIIAQTRSKASCAWTFVSQHLWHIWQQFGQHHPWVAVDRQGGRRVYHHLLQLIFEGAELRLLDESDDVSRYVIRRGDRAMTLSFETKCDANHLPVALASMTAKYTRELLMHRFNAFWRQHQPDLTPTAGYVQDGRRFLAEIDTLIDRLGIDRATLIRTA